jgi:hypothetical protein
VENAAQSRQGAEGRAANQGGLREEPSASVNREKPIERPRKSANCSRDQVSRPNRKQVIERYT